MATSARRIASTVRCFASRVGWVFPGCSNQHAGDGPVGRTGHSPSGEKSGWQIRKYNDSFAWRGFVDHAADVDVQDVVADRIAGRIWGDRRFLGWRKESTVVVAPHREVVGFDGGDDRKRYDEMYGGKCEASAPLHGSKSTFFRLGWGRRQVWKMGKCPGLKPVS
jgi:hypothetical protein